jgi:uncharacterized protein YndB with AHSA1/START domain
LIPTDTHAIEIEVRIEARPETVFSYFTDPDKYRRWQGVGAELDARPGGAFRVNLTERGTWLLGEYVEVDPPKRLVFTWGWESPLPLPNGIAGVGPGSTTVEVTFVPDGDGTVVKVRHDGLPNESAGAMHRMGWQLYLDRLAMAAAGHDPGPDPVNVLGGALS